MEDLEETDYEALVTEIKGHICAAQYRALRAVKEPCHEWHGYTAYGQQSPLLHWQTRRARG